MLKSQQIVISIFAWFIILLCITCLYKGVIAPKLQEQKQQEITRQQNQDKQFFQIKPNEKVLSNEDWLHLNPVGNLDIHIAPFKRGSRELSEVNQNILIDLSIKLKEKPNYYLIIKVISAKDEDKEVAENNMQLAQDRANAIVDFLNFNGINTNRMHKTSEFGEQSQVDFILAQ